LNILFIADVSISNIIGGAERVLYEQTTRLALRGHDVHILTRKLPEHQKEYEIISDVEEWRYKCNLKNKVQLLASTIKNGKNLFETLYKKYSFDCINFHQPFTSYAALKSSLAENIVKIYTCHSLAFEEFCTRNINSNRTFSKISSFFPVQILKLIERYSLKRSNKIAVLSKFTRNKLVDTYNIPKDKIIEIPGGVDINNFCPNDAKGAIRKKLKISHDKVILLTVRNLVQRMGLENLIKAFNGLEKKYGYIQLVIGGSGPLKNELIALARKLGIEQKVHFAGFISEDKLPLYYQMADLFVLPSKELEGFGLVTLEAMASGLPVVGTPIGGTKEILGNFDPSFLFERTDPQSMSELILKKYYIIKNNPQRWKEISNQCRSFVVQNYSWEKNVDALEGLFEKTLQK
jgi:glycosyltransferase involved in cell wall biosynthesis